MKRLLVAFVCDADTLPSVVAVFAQNTAGVTGVVTDPAGGVCAKRSGCKLTDTKRPLNNQPLRMIKVSIAQRLGPGVAALTLQDQASNFGSNVALVG